MAIRRVVTGQDKNGKSIIVSDEQVEPIHVSTTSLTRLWGAEEPPKFPQSGKAPAYEKMFPGPGGYRFLIMTLPPNSVSAPSAEEMKRIAPDVHAHMEKGDLGMHTTDTVDLEVVLSGEATQEFDDGVKVHLKAGDTFIQNGTRHRWSNRGSVPAVIAVVIIGGHPR